MPTNPNKLSQFWQELKRRGVIKVMTMYVASAFIIMEAADIMLPRLGLADWTVTLIIILLIVAFPIVTILSWIFDITPEGLTKTEDAEVPNDPGAKTGKQILKVSDLIIAVLVVVVIVLAFPRVFKNRVSLNAMTYPVTVVNEFGEKEAHRIFKEDYLSPLATFPFRNETEDSSKNWMQYGIQEGIYGDLRQFKYMSVGWDDANILQEQVEYANTHNYPHFLTGSFRMNHGVFEINSRLYQSVNGSIIADRSFKGSDFFKLVDSISLQVRIDLNISNQLMNSSPDLPFKEYYSDNLDAFRYFTIGFRIDSIYNNLNKAIQLDPTFALAYYERASTNYHFQGSHESAQRDINQAMNHRRRLLPNDEVGTRILYYQIQGDKKKAIALAEMEHDLYPQDVRILEELILVYWRTSMKLEEEKATLELNKLVPDRPKYQFWLAEVYLYTGKLNKGQVILEKLLDEDPRNIRASFLLGEIFLHQNDVDNAEELYNRVRLLIPEMEEYCLTMLDHCAYLRDHRDISLLNQPHIGIYRLEISEMYGIVSIQKNHLLIKGENQPLFYIYPITF